MPNTRRDPPSHEQEGWRLLAYMAGDNNLSADMSWALQSMKEYLDDPLNMGKEKLEVIAQYDPNGLKPRVLEMTNPARAGQLGSKTPAAGLKNGKQPGDEDGNLDQAVTKEVPIEDVFEAVRSDLKTTSRQRALADGAPDPTPVTSDLVACRFADLSTEAMLRSFIGQRLDGGSRKHMLVLSGHGAGVSGDFLTDEDPHSSLMISRLGEILKEACTKKNTCIDILGMDSCLMGMAEVACEVQDHVSFLVGSEGFVNDTGWPYHRVLKVLAATGDPEDAAKGIVEKYAAFYQDYEMSGSSTQIAALDLKKLTNLTTAVNKLAEALISAFESVAEDSEQRELEKPSPRTNIRDAVILAHWYAQSFKWGEYADLWDFCNQLRRFLPKEKFKGEIDAAEAVMKAVKGVVIRSCYCGPEFQHAHGIAIYFPWSELTVPPSYQKLKFATETRWHEFLDRYLEKTRRLRRGDNGQIPRRFGPDVVEVRNVEELAGALGSKVGSYYGSRFGSPYGSRYGSPYGSKMLGGALIVPANFQNVPDGYLREDLSHPDKFTGAPEHLSASAIVSNGR